MTTANTNITTLQGNVTTLDTHKVNKSDVYTRTLNDRSNVNVATTGYVDSSIDALKNNVDTAHDTLNEIAADLLLKANVSNPTFTGTANFANISTQALTDNGNITIKGNTVIGDQTTDTLTVTGTITFNNGVIIGGSNVATKFSGYDSSISSINSSLSTKATDSQVVHITGNESLSGVKTFNEVPKIGLHNIATTSDISTAIGNLVNSAPSTLDTLGEISTLLQTNDSSISTILSSMVTLSGSQTISGQKTFSTSPQVSTLPQGNNSTSVASTAYVDTGLALKADKANPTFTGTANFSNISTQALTDNGNILIKGNTVIGDQSTDTLTVTGDATFNNNVIIGGNNINTRIGNIENNYLTTANASSTYQPISGMTSYLTTANATSTYQPISSMSNYLTTSSASSTYQTQAGSYGS
jgi:hypothetical protein